MMADNRLKKKLKKKPDPVDMPNAIDPTGTVGLIKKRKLLNEAAARTPVPKTKLKERLTGPNSTDTGGVPEDWRPKRWPGTESKKKRAIPLFRKNSKTGLRERVN